MHVQCDVQWVLHYDKWMKCAITHASLLLDEPKLIAPHVDEPHYAPSGCSEELSGHITLFRYCITFNTAPEDLESKRRGPSRAISYDDRLN